MSDYAAPWAVRDCLDEFSALESRRSNFEDVWDEIIQYVVPHRTGMSEDSEEQKGRRKGSDIYDGTPLAALKTYASGTEGYLLSNAFKWFGLSVPDERLMNVRAVRLWLSHVEQVLYGMIRRSNFYRQMTEMFMDGGSFGTATMFMRWDAADSVERFRVLHPREVFIGEDQDGNVDTIYRKFDMSVRQISQRFGDDDVHKEIRKMFDEPESLHSRKTIIHAVKPNEDYDPNKNTKDVKRFKSIYIDLDHEHLIRKGGFGKNPYATWRVDKNSDEEYGRGPGWTALGDIKALYQYARTDITAAQMLVNPPLDIPMERASGPSEVRMIPGGRSFYEQQGQEVKRLLEPFDLRAGLDREERKQAIIEKHWLVPLFQMISQADKEMTATEARQRREEWAVLLGPHVIGLNTDVIEPFIDHLFNDAFENGLLLPPPEVLVQAGGGLEVDYRGPLAQAQRSFFKQEPFRAALADIAGVAQLQMQTSGAAPVLDNYNLDFISKEMSRASGLTEEALLEDKVIQQIRQARAEQAQAKQMAEQAAKLGKAAPGLNEPVQEGSILEQIA
jgi:hypothetical protein